MKKLISIFCALAIIVSVIFAVPTIVGAETQSDQCVAKDITYSGSPGAGTAVLNTYDGVLFDKLGENLITDPTVAAFDSNGDYLEYYDWETRDSSVVVNKNAWWDKPTKKYNGFEINPIQMYYASARKGAYTLNDPTLSHTADGSGVLKVSGHKNTNTVGYLPLPSMESHSYYVITFFTKKPTPYDTSYDRTLNGGYISIKSSAVVDDALAKTNFATLMAVHYYNLPAWIRCTFIVYTGNNSWAEPVIQIPGGANTTYYYDDFGMYKVDDEYGAACIAASAGTMPATTAHTNTELYPTTQKAVCLNYVNDKYIAAYDGVNFTEYGVNVCPDPTVSTFNDDVYSTYYEGYTADTVTDALAFWDKPAAKNFATANSYLRSLSDRNFVTKDTSYSHTADGSGAILVPPSATSGNAIDFTLPLPTLEKYSHYVISFWVKNPNGEECGMPNVIYDYASLSTGYNNINFDYKKAKEQSGKEWQRVVLMFYTGSKKLTDAVFIRINGIKNIVIDDFYVYKLNNEAFALDCLNESRLIKSGDLDGDLAVDFTDVKSFRDDFLKGSSISAAIADMNGDGKVDICDYVCLSDSAMKENTYYKYANMTMLNTSLAFYQGDTNRFEYKLKQALANENHTTKIAVLGDSITEGAGINHMSMHYTTKFIEWWGENISESVELIRRGSGSTDSHLGVHWVDETILPENPDIIFIEYINDELDTIHKEAYDSLVRRCLALESKPAVVLLEMSYYDAETDYLENQQEQHKVSAEAYGLPMISWRDAVRVALDTGIYKWSDLSPDVAHPNATGNALLAEMMVYFTTNLMETCESAVEPEAFNAPAVYKDKYANAAILSKGEVEVVDEGNFTNSFVLESPDYTEEEGWSTTTGGSITFKMTFKNLGILFRTQPDNYGVKYKVKIDNVVDIDYTVYNWQYCHAQEIWSFAEEGEHTVTVTVTEGQNFNLMGWLVS